MPYIVVWTSKYHTYVCQAANIIYTTSWTQIKLSHVDIRNVNMAVPYLLNNNKTNTIHIDKNNCIKIRIKVNKINMANK